MKRNVIFAWFAIALLSVRAESTNGFAIYLVVGEVPREKIVDGSLSPVGLRLGSTPIISDGDLLSYDINNHTFTITQSVAERIRLECNHSSQVPFIVVAGGEPIYVGVFTTSFSSRSSGVPAILMDTLRIGTETNVSLTIDRGYPSADFGRGEDRRSDWRVVSAIEKLFSKRERTR